MPIAHSPRLCGAAWRSLLGALVLAGAWTGLRPEPAAAAQGGSCANTLGVSRVIEIDTKPGPHFGQQQYKEAELLAPGEVVLTFDDGPLRSHTQPILNALDAQCAKATFFMVGSQAIADPDMVRRIIAKGHTVGNHTWSHANLQKSTPLKARQEIELGLSAVTAAAGQPIAPFFRFPYLAHTKAMQGYAQTRGFGVFSIDVDSQDWKTKNAASVHRDVLNQLAELGKGIILFHDIQPATAQALPGLLEALRAKGYRVVHVKPKAMATTLPEFDTLARDANARNKVASALDPLASKSLTWGAASPSVLGTPLATAARRVATAPQATPGATAPPQQGAQRPGYGPPNSAVGLNRPSAANPNLNSATGTLGGSALPPGGVYDLPPAPARLPRPRPPVEVDWRDKIFNH